jgi:hypothetical protein
MPIPAAARSGAAAGALRLQLGLEARRVHPVAALRRHQLGEVDGEAEGVVQLEDLAPRRPRRSRRGGQLVEALHPRADGGQEALLLGAGVRDHVLAPPQLRVGAAHAVDHRLHHLHQRGLAAPQQPGVAHRAAQDAAQHVAAPLVGGEDAVGQQEGGGARVVGQHAVRDPRLALVLVRHPHHLHRPLDDVGEEVGPVVGVHPLQHRRPSAPAPSRCPRRAPEAGAARPPRRGRTA